MSLHGAKPMTATARVKIADGKLVTTDNQIDPTTGTFKLKAVFENAGSRSVPESVRQRSSATSRCAKTLDDRAARRRSSAGSQGTFVYVVESENTVDARPVTIGLKEGSDTSAIERRTHVRARSVVVDGAGQAQAGSKVEVDSAERSPGDAPRRRRTHEPVAAVHPPAGRHVPADGGHPPRRASSPTGNCRSRRCRRSTTRRSRC